MSDIKEYRQQIRDFQCSYVNKNGTLNSILHTITVLDTDTADTDPVAPVPNVMTPSVARQVRYDKPGSQELTPRTIAAVSPPIQKPGADATDDSSRITALPSRSITKLK